jgi:hypothetical protein
LCLKKENNQNTIAPKKALVNKTARNLIPKLMIEVFIVLRMANLYAKRSKFKVD